MQDIMRKFWIATEKGDQLLCLQILKTDYPELAKQLLGRCNSDGWTPLHVAANEGHVSLIELFHELGA